MPFERRTPACPFLIRIAAAAALALAAPFGAGGAHAQAPGCPATGPAANVVCSDPALLDLADRLAGTIRTLVQSASQQERPQLIRANGEWSASLGRCLGGPGSAACLRQAYEERLAELGAAASGAPGVAAGTPGGEGNFSGRIPVEQAELPPPPGGVAAARADEAGNEPVPAAGEAAAIAAAADNAAGADDSAAEASGDDVLGEFRSAATGGAGAPGAAGGGDAESILTSSVWKAEVATGIRPGTIFVFQKGGALVTADCVESYRLGSWALAGTGALALAETGAADGKAEIVSITSGLVRLKLGEQGPGRELILRPAVAPFSCKGG